MLPENSPAGTEVFSFQMSFSAGESMAAGFPRLLNFNPLTNAFAVSMENTTQAKVFVTGSPDLDFETVPNHFIFEILAVGSFGNGDRKTLTVLLTDVDEPPVFLDEDTGLVTIANRMDRDSDTLRNTPTVAVTVTATYRSPGPPLFSSIILTVTVLDINDNPPICTSDKPRREVPETEAKGALIATVTCTDNDVEPEFREYSFTSFSCTGCTQRFALTSHGAIVLNSSLNFEDPSNVNIASEYNLLVVATDKNDTSLKGGAVIGSVVATDKDLPPTDIQFSLVSGGGSGGLTNIFHVDPKLGRISLLTNPDYEVTPSHTLVIRVVDGDPFRPLSATAVVTINITEANDEPPLCGPNKTSLVVPVDMRPGSSVQGFMLSCTDRDSPPSSFIYTISGATNVNNHFGFSPSAGTNITRLIFREPFDFSSGLDKLWFYSLTVLISDGNLRASRAPRTGTIIINVRVVDPDLTTTITTTTPRITYIAVTQNTFDADDWYVWFVTVLGALLLVGILAYLLYRCFRYLSTKECNCTCDCYPPKREVLTEVTKINTVFDGEEVDPVTKRVYEYNSKSGARRWKDTTVVSSPPETQPESSTLVISQRAGTPAQPPGSAQSESSNATRLGSAQSVDSMQTSLTSGQHQAVQLPMRSRPKVKPGTVPLTAEGMSEV
ncbi:cadherin-related family member 3-like [Alosa pseudoharengus]|uniref:cadherin-related family member 3-like n=1 Tax=Alosa pseudoharengus TaxID=34774 RepID=UPI003F8C0BDF